MYTFTQKDSLFQYPVKIQGAKITKRASDFDVTFITGHAVENECYYFILCNSTTTTTIIIIVKTISIRSNYS